MNSFDRMVKSTLGGGIPMTIFILAIIAGIAALQFTPREEEPQIVVPMVDVLIEAPGLSAGQVERQVATPVEKLLAQIPGVEHVYSTSSSGKAAVTLAFYVGEDREISILNTYNKLYANQDKVPGVVSRWMLRPIEVDDVPIMLLALWSDSPDRYSNFELRRLAQDVSTYLQGIDETSEVNIVGGRPRTVRILIDPESMGARKTTAADIFNALKVSNVLQAVDQWTFNDESIVLESGDFVRSVEELNTFVVNIIDGIPVYLGDIAEIIDGPAEPDQYTWIDFAPGHPSFDDANSAYPMVSISIAKQRGSNAVAVAENVHHLMEKLQREVLPGEIHIEVIRDYGKTADEKVNNLTSSLAFAVFTVVVFIGVFLGWRPALVVGLAVPICYGVSLALDLAFGYTINRVTLFALILSLGLLVDDPITGVDNISRFINTTGGDFKDRIVAAMAEIRVPLLMSTVTIVLAFIPLAFITGMMGPYMAPMAFNVPVSVITSTVVAFLVTPWLASRLLKENAGTGTEYAATDTGKAGFYRRLIEPLLNDRRKSKAVLWFVAILFLAVAMLPVFRLVPLKLLPFDNKNELQIVIDMPESSSLEHTAAVARQVSAKISLLPEIRAIAAYVGTPSPIDFNGMVRRYYQRTGAHMADLRLTLVDKDLREHQSHAVVLRLREILAPINVDGISIKVVEVPPGPPVMSTLVAEVYGEWLTPYSLQQEAAQTLMARLQREPFVVETDSTIQAPQQRWRFITDKQKAALSGVATDDINNTLLMANRGYQAGFLQLPRESVPLPIEMRLAPSERVSINDFERLQVKGRPGIVLQSSAQGLDTAPQPLVAIGELGHFEYDSVDQPIHRKDLRPVVYVTAEVSGRTPAEVIADVSADLGSQKSDGKDWRMRSFIDSGGRDPWNIQDDISISWTGEGEWKITLDVFRDMGLAFVFALIAIFVVLRFQTASTALSLIIMSAIPLTIIGIFPGFWLLNMVGEREIAGAPDPVLFTATAMIGMIALAGIVVRNSLILVEFIDQSRARGLALKEALLQAGSVRMRPVLLTAGTTLLGNLIITLDPVFSGLALAIMFGIIASTLFTLVVVPVVYLLVFERPGKDGIRV
ncbi:MAG: efflux RND transporter permease subunit [Xanthomonadales bacterium]|nr:efflux RND transporter permease subunit [Xanthomonadales bacterium]